MGNAKTRHRALGGLALGAILVFTVSTTTVATAAPEERSSPDSGPGQPLRLEDTNLELFSSLDHRGQCLLRSMVYPAGGVGFADSALPYDEFEPLDRAYSTVRAELIRDNLDRISGVTEVRDDTGDVATLVVHVLKGDSLSSDGFDLILEQGRQQLRDAYEVISDAGVRVELHATADVSLVESCRVQDAAIEALTGQVQEAGFETTSDAATGRVILMVQPGLRELASEQLAEFGHLIELEEYPYGVARSGRADSYTLRRGGSRISNGANTCTNSFRFNTTGLLTAGHCGSQSSVNTWRSPNGNVVAGRTGSWNFFPYGFDIRLLYGETYSNQIWVGNATGTGLLTGTGYVGVGSVRIGGSYLHSGAVWGQAHLSITQIAGPSTCFTDSLGTTCYLHRANGTGSNNVCRAGDSGAPWGLYDPSRARIAALAVHAIGPTESGAQPRLCRGTSVHHLIVALGGGTVG